MAEKSLGLITPGGSPKRATANQTDPTAPVSAYAYRIWHLPTNTANFWVGSSDLDVALGQGVYGWEPPPGGGGDVYDSQWTDLTAEFNMADIYIDSENATDSVLVSYLER